MKPLRCDFCGGQLIMDRSLEFATCEFCGTKYMKETIQDKIHEIRGQVSIQGAVETVTGDAEKQRILNNAETYIQIKEYSKALQAFAQITKQFPEDYRGWWGLYTTPIEQYFSTGHFRSADGNSLRNAYNLCSDKSVFSKYFDRVKTRYGAKLRLVRTTDPINLVLTKSTYAPLAIDSFSECLLFFQVQDLNFYTDSFKAFIKDLSNQYIEGAKNGTIYVQKQRWTPLFCKDNLYIDTSSNALDYVVKFIANVNNARYSLAHVIPDAPSPTFYKIGWGNQYADVTKINGFYGRWIYTVNKQGTEVAVLSSREITKPMLYRYMGRCRSCGGDFSGIFKPICKQCGKPKDY